MPVTLVVRKKGEPELEPVSFEGPRIVIGRGASCDLRLPDASVSARHASIRAHNAGWVIVDEGSTNGTRLNGEKLAVHSPRRIDTGDVLTLGRLELVVKTGAAPVSKPEATRELALALVARSFGDPSAARATIVVREGPDQGARLELVRDDAKTVGRDPRCALRLTDRTVPPIAIEVTLASGRARVAKKDARTDARIGERTLDDDPLPWGDGMALHLGASVLVFDDPVARALDASAQGDDEKFVGKPKDPPAEVAVEAAGAAGAAAAAPGGGAGEAAMAAAPAAPPPSPPEAPPQRPAYDRRRSWRGATIAFEVVAVILALLVLGGSVAGLWWLLKK